MRGRLRSEQRGATVVEFALVLPVFLAVVATTLFGGWLGVTKVILDRGAQEGARYASIPSAANLRAYPSDGAVFDAVDASTPLLTPTTVVVTEGTAGATRGAPFKVVLTYQVDNPAYALMAPLRLFGLAEGVDRTLTITSEAEVRFE